MPLEEVDVNATFMPPLVMGFPEPSWHCTVITEDTALTSMLCPAPAVNMSLGVVVDTKLAVIVPAPLICAVVEAVVGLLIWMLPVNVHDENWYPLLAVATMPRIVPVVIDWDPDGFTVPPVPAARTTVTLVGCVPDEPEPFEPELVAEPLEVPVT